MEIDHEISFPDHKPKTSDKFDILKIKMGRGIDLSEDENFHQLLSFSQTERNDYLFFTSNDRKKIFSPSQDKDPDYLL
jgi:hypothetical protein